MECAHGAVERGEAELRVFHTPTNFTSTSYRNHAEVLSGREGFSPNMMIDFYLNNGEIC